MLGGHGHPVTGGSVGDSGCPACEEPPHGAGLALPVKGEHQESGGGHGYDAESDHSARHPAPPTNCPANCWAGGRGGAGQAGKAGNLCQTEAGQGGGAGTLQL